MQQQGDQQGNENPFLNNLSKGREGQLRKTTKTSKNTLTKISNILSLASKLNNLPKLT